MPRTPIDPDRESANDTRWVKVFAIVVIALVLLVVVMHLSGLAGEGMHGHSSLSISALAGRQP